jgi:hypothetical protein
MTLRPAVFDADVAVLDIAGVAQALAERRQIVRGCPGRKGLEDPDQRKSLQLRVRGKWPCHSAADKWDELAPVDGFPP